MPSDTIATVKNARGNKSFDVAWSRTDHKVWVARCGTSSWQHIGHANNPTAARDMAIARVSGW